MKLFFKYLFCLFFFCISCIVISLPHLQNQLWVNPSKTLVDRALRRWFNHGARADNTSAVTLLLDPPGVQRRACERISVPQPLVPTVSLSCSIVYFNV